ncbi:MAG: YggS family pyridoxal phosphate-dependent enzyme [Baileyella intestinalis]|uniref:YggS family pyridoxal phosphate-dependent enzyme n=1 Tax=Baileyella intestinalis TaxID=2606709 RepID=UPI002A74E169|nr:YggS family pyridoxal phosphate-dependent enzyme [Baileyella intestinalis]MCI7685356.1 YggS family pyridoxal phosphate-dependent enzyme [Clostridiales bacterium]MDY2995653.1 YggS family pyridoxal phosphate-dependent enzyme [Baileyella intestinalis]
MGVRENYLEVLNKKNQAALRAGRNPEDITLMAVTKLHTVDEINEAIDAGATDIGENKVQELLSKYEDVKPVRWHLIGHLQTNKVKQIIDKVVMIHSVDSLHLAEEINKRAGNAGLVMDILIEINVGEEETKTGIQAEELMDLAKEITDNCENVRLRGVMCIPPYGEDPEVSRKYFRETRELFEKLQQLGLPEDRALIDTLSMGMSGDYETAVEEGSTIVRVGSAIFGKRNYR